LQIRKLRHKGGVTSPGWSRNQSPALGHEVGGRGRCAGGAPELSHDHPPSPQASAYLKQNKYQQAEELYREILSREDLPAPLGAPNTGTAGDAEQVRREDGLRSGSWGGDWRRRGGLTGVLGALPRPFVGAAPSPRSGSR